MAGYFSTLHAHNLIPLDPHHRVPTPLTALDGSVEDAPAQGFFGSKGHRGIKRDPALRQESHLLQVGIPR